MIPSFSGSTPHLDACRDKSDMPRHEESGLGAPAGTQMTYSRGRTRNRPEPLVLLGLCLLFQSLATRVISTYREFNAVIDEPNHIISGLELCQFGTYTYDVGHPPLARLALGLLPYLSGVRLTHRPGDHGVARPQVQGPYWRILTLARLGTLVFAPVLLWCLYRWSSALYGRIAGLAACALITFCPNIVAHAGLATIDFAGATTVFAAAYHIWRWRAEPGWARCMAAAIACSVAILCKFSALLYLPAILALNWLVPAKERGPAARDALRTVRQVVVCCLAAFLLVWVGYCLHPHPLRGISSHPKQAVEQLLALEMRKRGAPPSPADEQALHAVAPAISKFAPAFPPALAAGLMILAAHSIGGHEAFLLGSRSIFGWWYYFPVALIVKTTLPFLALLLVSGLAIALHPDREIRRQSLYPALGAAAVLGIAMCSSINIGVRHVLAIYPFWAVLASAAFDPSRGLRKRRTIPILGTVLIALHVADSYKTHPDYLAYFNQIARGTEEHFLGDSNLDWGQDLARLARYQQAHRIPELHLSYFGADVPENLGLVNVKPFGLKDRPTGWVAISVNHLLGLYLGLPPHERPFEWLRDLHPYTRIGKSIVLYNVPE
jgi:hypothetical protein